MDDNFKKQLFLMNHSSTLPNNFSPMINFDDNQGNQVNSFHQTTFGDVNVSNSSGTHIGTKIKKLFIGNYNVIHRPRTKRDYFIRGVFFIIMIIIFTVIVWFTVSHFYLKIINEYMKGDAEQVAFNEVIFISEYLKCNENSCYNKIRSEGLLNKCNFFIDIYGNQHVGSDWIKEATYLKEGSYCPHCLQICFMGDFNVNKMTESIKVSLKNILNVGKNKGKLAENFKITPFCCYKKTSNPGLNILKWMEVQENFVTGCRLNTNSCPWNVTSLNAFETSSKLNVSEID